MHAGVIADVEIRDEMPIRPKPPESVVSR